MKLPKTYEPGQYETDIYALWEKSNAFTPTHRGNKDTFSIVLPPPNANGNLHVGHSLMFAIQDAVIRYQRMQGKAALWLPGADHAGFETQVVYEKQLAKAGKSRFDLSREKLYSQIWDFVSENRSNFESQFRRLGASVDWQHYTYTLDEKIVSTAYQTFKKLWDEGLIYRGERLVNYCTFHRTGFADVEVEYKESKTPLYYIKYGPFTLATTRPETKFGDTAVAVHPDDDRYKQYVDTVIRVEGVNGSFEVRVVADEMVDPNFGTGAVKITPAHSFDDWEVAQRHNLPAVRVINHDGKLNHHAGQFEGMTVLEAREAVATAMDAKGLLVKVDHEYTNRVGTCYKCGTVIEPMLMEQWFIKTAQLAKPAIEALEQKQITFYPDTKRTQLITYLQNIRDWNISRQISWGIPIPAFQNVDDPDDWIYNQQTDQELIEVDGHTYRRDPDVFDTWFSSSSWPYATLGYPDQPEFKQYYPNSLMETGGEILYPWVSRMIMMGLYLTGDIPFRDVYIHGYVLAEDGSKMSKSVGNVISPMDPLEQYGSDALRMGLLAGRAPAVNRGYDPRRVEEARNFANKLWNVARFIEDKVGDEYHKRSEPSVQTPADAWMMRKLQQSTEVLSAHIEAYRLSEAYVLLYHLIWDDVADWFIEANKSEPNKAMLAYTLETILKLAHPFAPFVTETIWQTLKWEGDSLLITSTWPKTIKADDKQADVFGEIQNIVSEIRYIAGVLRLKTGITLYHTGDPVLSKHHTLIQSMTRLHAIKEVEDGHGLHLTTTTARGWLDLDQESIHAFLYQLREKQTAASASTKQLQARLNNESYVKNAPKKLVEDSRQQLAEAEATLTKLTEEYERFAGTNT